MRKPFKASEIFEAMTCHLGVKFIYNETEIEKKIALPHDELFSQESLAQLPEQLLNDLKSAALALSLKQTNELKARK